MRALSLMNGTFVAANFSVDSMMDGAGGGEADACFGDGGAGTTAATEDDGGSDSDSAAGAATIVASFDPFAISILVKYRNPTTPIATRQTTSTTAGHSQ